MGFFAELLQPRPRAEGGKSPIDDFWYTPIGGGLAQAGVRVDAETAMRISAVWACVRVIAESLASIPLFVYERRANGGRQRAEGYYLYDVLRRQPNRSQTALEFREMLTAHTLLRGNAYAQIVPGRRGFADQLIPLHPDRVDPKRQDDGTIQYRYRQPDGREIIYQDSEIFHLRGLSLDGVTGLSVISYARESFGLALATESYGAKFFSQNATPPVALSHPGHLSEQAMQNLKQSWMETYSGLGNAHKPAILEEGLRVERLGLTNEDAQFLATRSFQIADIARWFRVPLHMIQEHDKQTSWGTGIESLSLAFVIYTLLPWAARWDQSVARDLIVETDRYYAEHLFDALLRGDLKSRYEAYTSARNWGWLSVNDIRRMENMNPIGSEGDIYLQPMNMVEAGAEPAPPEPLPPPSAAPAQSARANSHYFLLLHEAAGRVVRKETVAVGKLAKRHANDAAGFDHALDEFYGEHTGYAAQALRISRAAAASYVDRQRTKLAGGLAVVETWEDESIAELIELAMEVNDG